MRWRGRRQSSNVQDRRGQGGIRPGGFGRGGLGGSPIRIPVGGGGRGGFSGILIIIVVFVVLSFLGINPLSMLGGGDPSQPGFTTSDGQTPPADDEHAAFISVVLAETEDVWNGIFQAEGADYQEPTLVLFERGVQSACGFASSASGPFYCPGDRQVYIDLNFFDELANRFGASGDFAQAYVVAHEVGHHVQNLIGVLPRFNAARQSMSQEEQNAMSVRVELQADCFAGIWAHFTNQRGLIEQGDIEEALNAANQIGDDTIQQRTQGYVVPESFSHGTSEQRMTWFSRGFDSGRLDQCDTFNSAI
jgi:predicted metalloprotease